MSLDALIMLSGALVAVLPFLGFPTSWDTYILLIVGIIIVVLGIVVRRRGRATTRIGSGEGRSFVENTPAQVTPHDTP